MKNILFVLAIFLSACTIKPTYSEQSTQDYLIQTKLTHKEFKNTGKSLKILNPWAANFLNTNNIIYSTKENEISSYLYSFWEDPPSFQYRLLLSDSLEKSGLFSSVLNPISKVKSNLFLESRILTFEHRIRGKKSNVIFEAKLFLIDANSNSIISSKNFSFSKPTKTIDAKGAVEAFGETFSDFIFEVELWLNKVLNAS